MKKISRQIDPEEQVRIYELFQKKNWEIDEKNENSLINRFIKTYIGLSSKAAREVYISLAQEYQFISPSDYINLIINMCESIFDSDEREDILVMPLLAKKDIKKIKSGTFVSYLFKSINFKYSDKLIKKSITIIDNYEILAKKIKKEKILFLVDDYIGSGKQFSFAFNDFCETIISSTDISIDEIKRIYIITLFINPIGLDFVTERITKYSNMQLIYSHKTSNKAFEFSEILQQNNSADTSHLGYNDCGELITLIRTPNNTIPLFSDKKSAFPRG